jgi:hypothetical protein
VRLYLKNLRLVDGTGAPARDGAALVIEGETMCPGGDFGFAWNPHGEYAKDIQVFVDVIGFDGDPLRDITVLQDRGRLSVMQGGRFVTRNF